MGSLTNIGQAPLARDDEDPARVKVWSYVFGFTPMAVAKCAVQLQIPDVLESHGEPMGLQDLSSAVGCSASILERVMRYLAHQGFFKLDHTTSKGEPYYAQTPLSRLFMSGKDNNNNNNNSNSMSALLLLESSPVMLAPWHRLSERARSGLNGYGGEAPFEAEHGRDIWEYAAEDLGHSEVINTAMSCHARFAMAQMVSRCPEVFEGIRSLVDVGGGDGTALRTLVGACPWIRGIDFDLPHVIAASRGRGGGIGIEYVEGNMFESVPKANAAFLMWVLHDWSDEECIRILKNCREAVDHSGDGKVIIAEAVIDEGREGGDEKFAEVRLTLDMIMLAHTEKGKERTFKEWEYVINEAGFSRFTVKNIQSIVSVIEAYIYIY